MHLRITPKKTEVNASSHYIAEEKGESSENLSRIKLWIRLELAVRKIQRKFRAWRVIKSVAPLSNGTYDDDNFPFKAYTSPSYYRHLLQKKVNQKSSIHRHAIYNTKYHQRAVNIMNDRSASKSSFDAVIQQQASISDKCIFWRNIIELRKSYPIATVDILIKAFIEAQGDLTRASCLVGNEEFVHQSKGNLTSSVRALFLPIFDCEPNSEENSFPIDSTMKRSIDMIRSLRTKQVYNKKEELMETFRSVVEKAYFHNLNSSNHNKTTGRYSKGMLTSASMKRGTQGSRQKL